MSTPAKPSPRPNAGQTYRRAGSGQNGPAQRRKAALRVFAVAAFMAVVSSVLYANSVLDHQSDAGALSGVLAAKDDLVAADVNTSVTVDVAGNDSGDADPTSYTVVTGPSHGSLGSIQADGTVSYTPDADWVGTDTFTYQVDETTGTYFDSSLLSTGFDGTAGVAEGATDPNWRISDSYGSAETAATSVAGWGPGWAAPTGNSAWICGAVCSSTADDTVVFHRDFQVLDNGTADHLVLTLDVFADDLIDNIFVNGVPTGISTSANTYCHTCSLNIALGPDTPGVVWAVGTNTISIEIRNSGAGPMGIMVRPSSGDEDGDTIADTVDRCWGTPAAVAVNAEGCRTESATVSIVVSDPAAGSTPTTTVAPTTTTSATTTSTTLLVESLAARDSDGDGLDDATELGPDGTPVDTDGDGTDDYLDLDSDNDGLSDHAEAVVDGVYAAVDGDGDGTPDWRDPTANIDATVEFVSVKRDHTTGVDVLTYDLRAANLGPAGASATVIAVTPADGAIIADWSFASWQVLAAGQTDGASLFAGREAAAPSCWIDATTLRCELGTMAPGWMIDFQVETRVYGAEAKLKADASITSMGNDLNIVNNLDELAVESSTPVFSAVADPVLAFTGVRFSMMWWLGSAVLLIGLGIGFVTLSATRRRDDGAYQQG